MTVQNTANDGGATTAPPLVAITDDDPLVHRLSTGTTSPGSLTACGKEVTGVARKNTDIPEFLGRKCHDCWGTL